MDADSDRNSTPDLLAQSRAGSRQAIETLLERHLPGLRAYVRLHLGPALRAVESASDIVQSVCADLLQELEGFQYQGEAAFRTFLYTAVLNKIRNEHRRYTAQKRSPGQELEPLDEQLLQQSYGALCSPSHHAIMREQVDLLERAFDALPTHYREVLTLAKIVGLPHEETALRMQRTVPATRNLLVRALSRLAGEMARLTAASRES